MILKSWTDSASIKISSFIYYPPLYQMTTISWLWFANLNNFQLDCSNHLTLKIIIIQHLPAQIGLLTKKGNFWSLPRKNDLSPIYLFVDSRQFPKHAHCGHFKPISWEKDKMNSIRTHCIFFSIIFRNKFSELCTLL